MDKIYQVVWNSLIDYGRLEWQCTFKDLENAPDVVCKDVLWGCDKTLGVSKALLLLVAI